MIRRAAPPLFIAAAAAAAACSEVGTDPKSAVSIAIDTLRAPAIVEGDSLRDDSTGVAIPLRAFAFNSSGDTIADAPFAYFPRDTGGALEVVGGNYIVARKPRTTGATIIASLGSLQLPQTFFIVPRPDTVAAAQDSVKAKVLSYPDTATTATKNLSEGFGVRVLHDSTPDVAVRSWAVFFRVDTAAPQLADSVALVTSAGRRTTEATTNESGVATLFLRVYPKHATTTTALTDTVVVRAWARYRGQDIKGSPVRLLVPLIGFR